MAWRISCYAQFKEYFTDDTFGSYEEFHEKFQKFQDATLSMYRICDSNKVETENVRRKTKLSLCLKYSSVSFCCVHYSNEKSKGNAIRTKPAPLSQSCPSIIRLSSSARDQQLRICHANLTHNHVLNSDLYKSYKENQLDIEVAEETPVLPNNDVPKNNVKAILENKFGKVLHGKDSNPKGKGKKNTLEQVGLSLRTLENNKEAKFVADQATRQLQVVALATATMKRLFERFPDAIFIDIKSKPNKHGFGLYQIIVEDQARHSRTVLYVFLKDKTNDALTTVLEVFLELFPNAKDYIKTVTLGMGFQQLQHVQKILPVARILWCQYRVLRLCKKRIDRLPISFSKKRQLFIRLRDAMMAEEESMFIAATEEIRGLDSKFFDCFQEEWLPSVEFWARFERRNLPIVTNTTNILNQDVMQRALASSKNITDVLTSLASSCTNYSPNCVKGGPVLPAEIKIFLKHYGGLEAALMRKNFSKLKCLTLADEEKEDHVQVVREKGLSFIVKIDGETLDCNCTFNSRYSLPCRHIVYACQNLNLNLGGLTGVEESPPELEVQTEKELSKEEKLKTLTEITGRMNRALGRLGNVHFQKWMKVLQEVKNVIEAEFTENCNGNAPTLEGCV